MRADRHPFHYTPILDDPPLDHLDDLTLIEVWTAKIHKVRIEGSPVFFSNRWGAAKFLSPQVSDDEKFFTKVHSLDSALAAVAGMGQDFLFIDPCIVCGWSEAIPITGARPQEVMEKMGSQILMVRDRIRSLKETCVQIMGAGRLEDAFEMLRNVVGHLDPGAAECHFLIGQCALALDDRPAYELALSNLANIDKDFRDLLACNNTQSTSST